MEVTQQKAASGIRIKVDELAVGVWVGCGCGGNTVVVEHRERERHREVRGGVSLAAVSSNLLQDGRTARRRQSPGRAAFPACLAARQPLFVSPALYPSRHPHFCSPPARRPSKSTEGERERDPRRSRAASICARHGYKHKEEKKLRGVQIKDNC